MAFIEDVVDWIAGEVSHIGLSTDGTTEVSGGGYEHLAPTYGAAADGSTDLAATLAFDGPANEGPVTHLIFKRAGATWVIRPADEGVSFNSDGRLDLTAAPISSDFLA